MVAVDTDEKGIMKADVLEELIKQDKTKVCCLFTIQRLCNEETTSLYNVDCGCSQGLGEAFDFYLSDLIH